MIAVPAIPEGFPTRVPLPPNPYDPVAEARWNEAYSQCLQNEVEAGDSVTRIILARCLGYLIIEACTPEGRNMISDEMNECKGDREAMDSLAWLFINHLIRLFRQNKGITPAPTEHPSRPSFEEHRFFFSSTVEAAPKDHSSAKRAALERDSYCCMVTGLFDNSVWKSMSNAEKVARGLNTLTSRTNYCHIFPPSTNWELDAEVIGYHKADCPGTLRSIVNSFAGINVLDELDGKDKHRLSNGLTMTVGLRGMFDELDLWFEEVPNQLNTYRICTTSSNPAELLFAPQSRIITFTTTSAILDLPDPRYLKLHAAVCRVAQLSGVAEYLDALNHDVETLGVLSNNGSSADILASRLFKAMLVA